ncbi:cytochrome b5 [Peniophora sp. CONT]|nr:cytochrome b5 [Peniophora sp. CONT]
MVSTKRANKPFLVYKEYRDQQTKLREEWLERKKEREEKLARGEEVGPEEPDPTYEPEVGVFGLMKFLVYVLLFIICTGKFVTGDWMWGYDSKWLRVKTYFPEQERLFSESFLAKFDGSEELLPLYLAIDGDVYDVSSNRRVYGPGGSYHNMAGVDAARAFATGCFAQHRTHDLRGLSENELKSVQHWKDFFSNHKDYTHVGRVSHRPIDPMSPIPEPCKPPKAKKPDKPKSKSASTPSTVPDKVPKDPAKHQEL